MLKCVFQVVNYLKIALTEVVFKAEENDQEFEIKQLIQKVYKRYSCGRMEVYG
jgi:hypothetical protein